MTRNKVFARVVSLFLILTILMVCVPVATISAIDTADCAQQIEYKGGWNPPQYPTDGTLYNDRIAVSKTIAPTEDENYFDVTLEVVAKPRVINQSIDVVVVMDVSNTMNSTHEGLGAGDAGYSIKDSRRAHAKSAINTFLDSYATDENLSTDRRFGLVTFNSYASAVVPLTTVDSATRVAEIMTTVNDITASVNNSERFTNTEGGLQLAKNLLSKSDAAFKYIIFVTDGFPTTYIESDRHSTFEIKGFETYMTGAYDDTMIGTDGYFADPVTKKICTYGVNYSDKAADRADDVAADMKDAGINIFTIGIDVDEQSISDYLNSANTTAHTTIDRTNESFIIGTSTESYKVWLRDEIAGGNVIEKAEETEHIHRYAQGNSTAELQAAFENILKDIEIIPAEIMDKAYTLDQMSDYVEFINFYNPDGSKTDAVINTKNGKDIATFDSETKTVKWILTTTQNWYIDDIGNYVLTVSYRVRLKNEMKGFEFNKAFPTGGAATFYFKTVDFATGEALFGDNSLDYFVPEVEGYFGNLSFTKIDSVTGEPLKGAVFTLEHYGESCHICSGDATIESLTASSDEQGIVSFENLPSGHKYALIETDAPEGYEVGAVHSVNIAYGKTFLDGEPVTEDAPAFITNSNIVPAKVKLNAQKTLKGRELKSGEFTLVLDGEYIDKFSERKRNDENGKVEFFEFIFDKEGTYNFKVYEEKGNDSTIVYDTAVYDVEFNVTLSDDGKEYLLETKINGKDIENDTEPAAFEFVSTLRKGVGVTLSADKLFDGKVSEDGLFSFVLKDTEENIIDTKSSVNGTVSFDKLSFTEEGIYRYTISESHQCSAEDTDSQIFFDHRVYDVVVTVTAPEYSDSFTAEAVYYLKGKEVDKALFENFTRTKATLKLNALNILTGREPKADEFTFEIRKISGELVDRATNDAQGNISFETVEFDRVGYFVFFISQKKGTDSDIVYDNSVYKVFVTSEAHHNLSSYYLEATVYETDGDGDTELAHMHGVDLAVAADGGINFDNSFTSSEPASTVTEPAETEPVIPTQPLVTEPAESEPAVIATESVKTEPFEPTEATEPEVSKPQETVKPSAPDFVQTGYDFNLCLWIAVLFVAGGIGAVTIKAYKRKEE